MKLLILAIISLTYQVSGEKSTQDLQDLQRIGEGNFAKPGQFPYHVTISNGNRNSAHCGGSLIHPIFILTVNLLSIFVFQ